MRRACACRVLEAIIHTYIHIYIYNMYTHVIDACVSFRFMPYSLFPYSFVIDDVFVLILYIFTFC